MHGRKPRAREKAAYQTEQLSTRQREKFIYSGSLVRSSHPQEDDNRPSWNTIRPKTGAKLKLSNNLNIIETEQPESPGMLKFNRTTDNFNIRAQPTRLKLTRPKSSAVGTLQNKLRQSAETRNSLKAGWMLSPNSSSLKKRYKDDEEPQIPVRTNFTKVILKTYSREFNLHKERHRTQMMVNISRESCDRIKGGNQYGRLNSSNQNSMSAYNSRNQARKKLSSMLNREAGFGNIEF